MVDRYYDEGGRRKHKLGTLNDRTLKNKNRSSHIRGGIWHPAARCLQAAARTCAQQQD